MTDLTFSNSTPSLLNDTNAIIEFIELNFESIYNSMDINTNSKKTYISNGKDFFKWVQANGLNINTYRNYKEHLRQRTDIGDKSKNYKLAASKMLLDELHAHYRVLPLDITKGVKGFKISSEHVKDGLNQNEVEKVRAYIQSLPNAPKRTRLNTMYALLTLQGLRQFEICNTTIEDLNLNYGTMSIKGKGNDSKTLIDLHPETVKALKDYLTTSNKKSGYLFTSEKGTTKGERLNERGFRKIFDSVFDALDIDRSTHGFRHFFVTRMLEATNGNIGVVKQFSRHKTIQAVMFYDDRKKKKEMLPTYYSAFAGI
jgi:integrase/recombinase XerC